MDRSPRFERLKRVDRRNALMVFFIILFAFLLLILLFRLNAAWSQRQYQVLVTQSDLTRGMRISSSDLIWRTFTRDKIQPEYFTQNKIDQKDVIGGVVVHDIPANTPVAHGDILLPSAAINYQQLVQPNMRAVMLPIIELGPGFVRAGDYVDILVTFDSANLGTMEAPHGATRRLSPSSMVSRTLLKNVLVLGVYPSDQNGTAATAARPAGPFSAFSGAGINNRNPFWVTFELYPKQAEMMAVANEMGIVSLSLQGQVVGEVMEGSSYTTSQYVAGINPGNTVVIIRGSAKEVINLER